VTIRWKNFYDKNPHNLYSSRIDITVTKWRGDGQAM